MSYNPCPVINQYAPPVTALPIQVAGGPAMSQVLAPGVDLAPHIPREGSIRLL